MIELYKELEGPLGESAAKALIEALERMSLHKVGRSKRRKAGRGSNVAAAVRLGTDRAAL